jgi:hypothetical protein
MLVSKMMRYLILAIGSFLMSPELAFAAESMPTIVIIDFALRDDMVPGPGGKAPGADEVSRRTEELRKYFVEILERSDKYQLIELDRESDAYKALVESHGRLFECKRCIVTFGRAVHSDYVLHGWVQRVSNLIINLNVEILDSESGKVYDRASVDTRGNTDKSWQDGVSFLKRHLEYDL